jgi:hypothetical protein
LSGEQATRKETETVIIEVNDKWRIVSDEHCWAVQERRNPNRKYRDGWRSVEWHARPHEALRSLSERRLRRLQGRFEENAVQVRRIIDELRAVADRIEAMLAGKSKAA